LIALYFLARLETRLTFVTVVVVVALQGEIRLLEAVAASVPSEYGHQVTFDLWMSEDYRYLFAQYAFGLVQGNQSLFSVFVLYCFILL